MARSSCSFVVFKCAPALQISRSKVSHGHALPLDRHWQPSGFCPGHLSKALDHDGSGWAALELWGSNSIKCVLRNAANVHTWPHHDLTYYMVFMNFRIFSTESVSACYFEMGCESAPQLLQGKHRPSLTSATKHIWQVWYVFGICCVADKLLLMFWVSLSRSPVEPDLGACRLPKPLRRSLRKLLVQSLRAGQVHQMQCSLKFLAAFWSHGSSANLSPPRHLSTECLAHWSSRFTPCKYIAKIECDREEVAFMSVAPTWGEPPSEWISTYLRQVAAQTSASPVTGWDRVATYNHCL